MEATVSGGGGMRTEKRTLDCMNREREKEREMEDEKGKRESTMDLCRDAGHQAPGEDQQEERRTERRRDGA